MKNNQIFISNSSYNVIQFSKGKGKWYKVDDPAIIFNITTGEYLHAKSNAASGLTLGIIDVKDGQPVNGYYIPNARFETKMFLKEGEIPESKGFISVEKYNSKVVCMPVLNTDVAMKIGTNVIFGQVYNDFISNTLLEENKSNSYLAKLLKKEISFINTHGYPYSLAEHSKQTINTLIESVRTSLSDKVSENQKKLYKLMSPLSFGVELETTGGFIPDRTIWETGFVPLKDGSIKGHEYVSIPYMNEIGIKALSEMANVALRNCSIDKFCSLHVHIGNFKFTKREISAFYTLCYRVQQEVFDFVPPYKRDETYFASKQQGNGKAKDHCKPLRGLNLSSTLSEDEKYEKIANFVIPPGHNDEANKWNKKSRYFWVNMLPFMTNGHTIEFRLHEPSLNYQKIVLWLMICAAMIKYAKQNTNNILKAESKIMFTDIFDTYKGTEYGDKVAGFLAEYVNFRTNNFMQLFSKGNYADDSFLKNDKKFKYEEKAFRQLFI
jgi:hypothetical protein